MIKRNVLLWSIFSLFLFLFACGQEGNNSIQDISELNLAPIEVSLILPEEVNPNTEYILQALVTQGDEKVNDASEVVFEVWRHGEKETSDMIEAELSREDGVYEITYYFSEEHLYYVQPHVTARGAHVMPVVKVKVGDIPEGIEDDHFENMEDEHNHH